MIQIYKKFIGASLVLIAVIVFGTFGFWIVSNHDYSLMDCFYMTIITITTIGYGEIVEVSKYQYGRLFTIIVIFLGVGIFTYILTNITALLVSDELLKSFKKRKILNMISKLEDHYILCGTGDIGLQIADELRQTKRDFVLIDKNDIVFPEEFGKDVLFIQGDATDEELLLKAGLQNAKGVFSITGDDNSNLVITFTVKQFNPAIKVVSRCRDLKHVDKLKKAGADSVISTRLIGGLRMVSEMVRPTVVTFLDTMLRDKEQSLRIEEIDISDKFINKTIAETGIKSNKKAVLLALKKGNDWIFNPSDKEVLDKGSTFILMVTPEQRIELIQELS